jgi:hypothetical protein
MLLTNHVLSGAVLGAVVRRPVPAFVLGVASHFVLDAVPHWGDWKEDNRKFLRVAVPDGLTALAALAILAAAAPAQRRLAVTAGMFGAALPDADKPTRLWFGFSPFPAAVGRFHGRIQDEAPGRFPVEAATAAVLAATAAVILRGDDPPYPPLRSAPRGGADRITSHSPGLSARFAGLVRSPVRNHR